MASSCHFFLDSPTQLEADELSIPVSLLRYVKNPPEQPNLSGAGTYLPNYPFHEAVCGGNLELVKFMLRKGLDISEKKECSTTPLYATCSAGNYDTALYLLQQGALVDAPSLGYVTPLCMAVQESHPQLVKLLLSLGAAVNPPVLRPGLQPTPLHAVCTMSSAGRTQGTSGCGGLIELCCVCV